RTFVRGLEAVATKGRHVQKNIGQTVVRNDEPITFGYIEPLDRARQLDDTCRFFGNVPDDFASPQPDSRAESLWSPNVRRCHDHATLPLLSKRREAPPNLRLGYHRIGRGEANNGDAVSELWKVISKCGAPCAQFCGS